MHIRSVDVQAARQSAEAEADSMKAEVDAVVARQQERVADWEAAVAEEEAALAAKQQELQANCIFAFPSLLSAVIFFLCKLLCMASVHMLQPSCHVVLTAWQPDCSCTGTRSCFTLINDGHQAVAPSWTAQECCNTVCDVAGEPISPSSHKLQVLAV